FDEHVPRRSVRRLFPLELLASGASRFIIEKANLAAALIHPLRGRFCIGIESDGEAPPAVCEILNLTSRRELASGPALKSCRSNAGTAKRAISHVKPPEAVAITRQRIANSRARTPLEAPSFLNASSEANASVG